jgi:deazaflavin-dependent oxidoreductase (nitroreductase family)
MTMGPAGHQPRGVLRLLLRAPLVLCRARPGRMLGHRLLRLVHIGRTSGRRRETVLEVVHYDPHTPEVVVVSGWGERSDCYRNITATPAIEIHPRAWRRIAPLLGFPRDPGAPVAQETLARNRAVAFTPRAAAKADS